MARRSRPGALAVLKAAPAWYLTATLAGEPVGVGRVAIVEDWVVGLLPQGVRHVALQVLAHHPAVDLYARLG